MSTSPNAEPSAQSSPTRLRLWPLAVIAALAAVVLLVIWRADLTRSWAVVYTGQTILASLFAVLGWLLCFSGLQRRTRVVSFGVAVSGLLLAVVLLRVDHVSGDLVPVLRWRFSPKGYERLAAPPLGQHGNAESAGLDWPESSPQDWPQFLGPRRDGMLTDLTLETDWEKHPPKLVWRQPIGAGCSSFAVVGPYCLTQEQRGPQELVTCYELASGKLLWSHGDESLFESKIGGDGPRATPTVADGQVFAMGANGLLNALDAATGEPLWPARNVLKDTSPTMADWGKACSPLVLDDLVVVTGGAEPGPSLIAYDRRSGKLAWKADDEQRGQKSYSSPMIAELCGQEQIVILNDNSVAGHDTTTGTQLWEHPWPGDEPKVTQPVPVGGDRLLIASGYGVGSALLQLSMGKDGRIQADEVWKNRKLKPKFTNLVHRGGFVYGLDEGILVCLEIATGAQRWKKGRYGHGQILLVGEVILVQAEQGDVALVEASPKAFRELARFPALSGRTWNNPVLVPPYLLVRNSEEAACYELKLAGRAAAPSVAKGQ